LRGEVGSLRRQTNEMAKLQTQNQELRSSLAKASAASRPRSEAPSMSTDAVPKESWAFVGYSDPESAFQSTVWAMSQGDAKTFLASLSPLADEMHDWKAKSETQIAEEAKREMEKVKGFRILTKDTTADDEVVLGIYAEGIGESARFKLQRIGGEWKFAGPVKGPRHN
jgi:hypothetical protein